MLYESFASETSFFSRLAELSARHPWDAPASPFRPTWHQPSFERLGVTLNQTADQIAWRRRIADAFQLYPSLCAGLPPAVSLPGVRVHTVFHCPSGGWDVAQQICSLGFAQLSTTDAGFFAQVNLLPQHTLGTHIAWPSYTTPLTPPVQGYYFSFDLDYAVRQYGTPDANGFITVIVCNVAVGNIYPVIETPASEGGDAACSLEGRPGVPKYDAHGILVDFDAACLPCPHTQWPGRTMYSELVLFDTSSILPRCVIAVTPPTFP